MSGRQHSLKFLLSEFILKFPIIYYSSFILSKDKICAWRKFCHLHRVARILMLVQCLYQNRNIWAKLALQSQDEISFWRSNSKINDPKQALSSFVNTKFCCCKNMLLCLLMRSRWSVCPSWSFNQHCAQSLVRSSVSVACHLPDSCGSFLDAVHLRSRSECVQEQGHVGLAQGWAPWWPVDPIGTAFIH